MATNPDLEAARAKATAFLREDAPRNAAEEAALQAINNHRWILWHADDRDLCVALLLSRLGLLRDKAYEDQQQRGVQIVANLADRERRATAKTLSYLSDLATQAANRLDAGADPAETAAWLRSTRGEILAAQEQAKRTRAASGPEAGVAA